MKAALSSLIAILALAAGQLECPPSLDAVYADMHDGDQKQITIDGSTLTILPYNNNETWIVSSTLDIPSCSASVDFNVDGKPSPPPVNLTATFLYTVTASSVKKSTWEFTDPTGTLADSSYPLNHWVEFTP